VLADLSTLPSRHEVFFGKATLPSDVYASGKAEALLGFVPFDSLGFAFRASM
jgi:hypothetical protein